MEVEEGGKVDVTAGGYLLKESISAQIDFKSWLLGCFALWCKVVKLH